MKTNSETIFRLYFKNNQWQVLENLFSSFCPTASRALQIKKNVKASRLTGETSGLERKKIKLILSSLGGGGWWTIDITVYTTE
jgi:hypothetical protein